VDKASVAEVGAEGVGASVITAAATAAGFDFCDPEERGKALAVLVLRYVGLLAAATDALGLGFWGSGGSGGGATYRVIGTT